jgi:hypothetical protein
MSPSSPLVLTSSPSTDRFCSTGSPVLLGLHRQNVGRRAYHHSPFGNAASGLGLTHVTPGEPPPAWLREAAQRVIAIDW